MDTLIMLKRGQNLRGTIELPLSKSLYARMLLLGWKPTSAPPCEDSRVLLDTLQRLPDHIDVGAAGTAMRFLTAYLSTVEGTHVLTGSVRMQQRPIGILVEALRQMGASITYMGKEGFPPLRIVGGSLQGGHIEMRGDVSSQYVSALLLSVPRMQGDLSITLKGDILSRPYIDTTLSLMQRMGYKAFWQDDTTILASPHAVEPAHALGEMATSEAAHALLEKATSETAHALPEKATSEAAHALLEADWSAASYWYEMVALSPDASARIELIGLQEDSLQGDSVIASLFRSLGVHTEFTPQGAVLTKSKDLVSCMNCSLRHHPDLAQTLVATCLFLGIPFSFQGLSNLRIKETDRLEAMQREYRRLGFVLSVTEDGTLSWDGTQREAEQDPLLHTYEDHRMALSLAPLCYRLPSLRLQNPEVVAKSYPRFWEQFSKFNTVINV